MWLQPFAIQMMSTYDRQMKHRIPMRIRCGCIIDSQMKFVKKQLLQRLLFYMFNKFSAVIRNSLISTRLCGYKKFSPNCSPKMNKQWNKTTLRSDWRDIGYLKKQIHFLQLNLRLGFSWFS